jgi:endonuclease/exonuclease/phosphatase family metal-dependent hydrolase
MNNQVKKEEILNPYLAVTKQDRISIMQFNVENLFDTTHDIGKDDFTFLPYSHKHFKEHKAYCETMKFKKWKNQCLFLDWSKKNLQQKMQELANAILLQNSGKGPDILVMEEVENISVLEELRRNYLQKAHYNPAILIEGRDKRGIDTAILSRLPLIDSPSLHYVPFSNIPEKERLDTRPILEATFKLPDGELLTVFANHFPAPFHPMIFRKESFNYLNQLLLKLPKDRYVIAAGDFNVITPERTEHHLLKNTIADYWIIAHDLKELPYQGTEYYHPKKNWSFLDMILLNKKFQDKDPKWQIDLQSIKIANDYAGQKKQLDGQTVPNGYDLKSGVGVSDHWPLYLEIVKKR